MPSSNAPKSADEDAPASDRLLTNSDLRALERKNLIAVLDHKRWKLAGADGAAEFLGLHPATLASRLKSLGIERPRTSR